MTGACGDVVARSNVESTHLDLVVLQQRLAPLHAILNMLSILGFSLTSRKHTQTKRL